MMNEKLKKKNVLIFTGGPILTMAENIYAEAITVEGDTIRCVGSLDECRHFAREIVGLDHQEINLEGKCMMPGFLEIHAHMMMLGMSLRWADVSYPKCKCIDDITNVLKERLKELPPEDPVRGFGYDQRHLKELRHLTKEDLDRVATDRPVQILHVSGHVYCVNSYSMKEMGIGTDTPDPEGGKFGRDEQGRPNGSLFDSACDYLAGEYGVKIGNHGPNFHMPDTQKALQEIIKLGQNEYLKYGITTTHDVQVTKQEMESYLKARDNGVLKLRLVVSYLSNHLDDLIKVGLCSGLGDEKISIGPLKLYCDGAINGGTAYTQYREGSIDKAQLYHGTEGIKELIIKAHKYGLETATHGQGDGAIELILQAVEQAQKECHRDGMHHRIEHCSLPSEEQVKRMAELGVWCTPQPHNIYDRGDALIKTFGEDKAGNIQPVSWWRKYGVPLIITSDTPVSPVSTMEGLYAAVNRKVHDGTVLGSQHKMTVEEALKAYTINPAKCIHKDHQIGSIEVGKFADFAILDRNPFEVQEDELIHLSVMETWIGGEKIYSK